MFLDENVQDLLRRRASLVEDDNPDSPSTNQINNQNFTQQSLQYINSQTSSVNQFGQSQQTTGSGGQSQSHIFLPPTSPAVAQTRGAGSGGGVPTPSPVHHNYFAQSPGMTSAPPSNAPSIAQSPGGGVSTGTGANSSSGSMFPNFGSPAIPHTSPASSSHSQILTSSMPQSQLQQPHSHPSSHQQHMVQSPSGFMSPVTSNQQQNYANQSPGNYSGIFRYFFSCNLYFKLPRSHFLLKKLIIS